MVIGMGRMTKPLELPGDIDAELVVSGGSWHVVLRLEGPDDRYLPAVVHLTASETSRLAHLLGRALHLLALVPDLTSDGLFSESIGSTGDQFDPGVQVSIRKRRQVGAVVVTASSPTHTFARALDSSEAERWIVVLSAAPSDALRLGNDLWSASAMRTERRSPSGADDRTTLPPDKQESPWWRLYVRHAAGETVRVKGVPFTIEYRRAPGSDAGSPADTPSLRHRPPSGGWVTVTPCGTSPRCGFELRWGDLRHGPPFGSCVVERDGDALRPHPELDGYFVAARRALLGRFG